MVKKKLVSGLSSGGLSDLRNRLFFVLLCLMLYRLGTYVPVPGLDPVRVSALFNQHGGGVLGIFNMFSGGAFSRMTIFALAVMPYISASIILQIYATVSPKLQQLKKEGNQGQRKINQYTRYTTVFLSFFQSVGISKWLVSNGVAITPTLSFYFIAIVTLVTGTMFLMWLGEQMTERGIGNGISLIIFSGIAARFPGAVGSVLTQVKEGQMSPISLFFIVITVLFATIVVVHFERAERRIKINYAQRQQGRKLYASQSSHLPLKINMSGVIPPIFALSIIGFPVTLASFFSTVKEFSWLNSIVLFLQFGTVTNMLVTAILVVFFSFFYTALVFNPKETAEDLKKSGAFIPGIRPGAKTADYIGSVTKKLTLVGSIYLSVITLFPQFLKLLYDVPFYFGGTSLLIIVVVVMDFMAQVQAHWMSHQYESLMKKSKKKGSKIAIIR